MSSGWPICTTSPSFIRTMRPPSATASSRSWETKTMVFLSFRCNSRSSDCMSRRISGSSALNASSIRRMSASAASARATGPLLHAARQFMRILGVPALQADELDRLHGGLVPARRRHVLELQAERHVRQDGPVRQQREVLEHHPEGLLAERQQVLAAELRHVDGRRRGCCRSSAPPAGSCSAGASTCPSPTGPSRSGSRPRRCRTRCRTGPPPRRRQKRSRLCACPAR